MASPNPSAVIDLARMTPGFADPVLDAQALFRRIMEATARPGRIEPMTHAPLPPADGCRGAGAIALTLLDFETTVCLVGTLGAGDLGDWLRFHTGCPLTDDPGAADFVFAHADQAPALARLNPGDPKYPERAATLVLIVPQLEGGLRVRLTGPGVNGEAIIAPQGLGLGFWAEREDIAAAPPLGVDVILASEDAILCLPRTTRCEPV